MTAIQMSSRPIDIIGTHCSYFGDGAQGSPTLPSGWISLDSVLTSNPIINSSVLLRREIASGRIDVAWKIMMSGYVPHELDEHSLIFLTR